MLKADLITNRDRLPRRYKDIRIHPENIPGLRGKMDQLNLRFRKILRKTIFKKQNIILASEDKKL